MTIRKKSNGLMDQFSLTRLFGSSMDPFEGMSSEMGLFRNGNGY
jgi:hypothetical protein